jgi:hypothetical protein
VAPVPRREDDGDSSGTVGAVRRSAHAGAPPGARRRPRGVIIFVLSCRIRPPRSHPETRSLESAHNISGLNNLQQRASISLRHSPICAPPDRPGSAADLRSVARSNKGPFSSSYPQSPCPAANTDTTFVLTSSRSSQSDQLQTPGHPALSECDMTAARNTLIPATVQPALPDKDDTKPALRIYRPNKAAGGGP